MAAPTVYDNVAEDAQVQGQLFLGYKFWVAQRVPIRTHLLADIRNNGGVVVLLEKQADYMIADHFRRDCPPGSISYTFIEESVKKGELQDPESYLAGPPVGTARPVGAAARPTKSGRAEYTAEEDRILYKWVRDCEAQGGLASGNEIYKQLEAKYPRHSWQSWRDHYLKQLRNRPPSAFNIPDNAPPSPPSDGAASPAPVVTQEMKTTSKKGSASSWRYNNESRLAQSKDYTVSDFDKLFDKDDWENLYANVHHIKDCSAEDYVKAWKGWAEEKTQTAEQWRQYFEKVVLPQWQRDPVWKREKVRKEFEAKQEETASQSASQPIQQQRVFKQEPDEPTENTVKLTANTVKPTDNTEESTENTVKLTENAINPTENPSIPAGTSVKNTRIRSKSEDGRFDHFLDSHRKGKYPAAYCHYAREKKWSAWDKKPGMDYTELHTVLMAQWDNLSDKDKAPYFALEAAKTAKDEGDATRKSPQVWLSSSTAVHETPAYITEAYEKALKRIHEGTYAEPEEEHVQTPRPVKRRKSESLSPVLRESVEEAPVVGASQAQAVEISSDASSISEPQLPHEEDTAGAAQTQGDSNANFPDSSSDFEGLQAIPRPKDLELASSDYPSNTPTPRAPRHRAAVFDTQAILSSPSQGFALEPLPLPRNFTQAIEEADEEVEARADNLPAQSPLFEPSSPNREPPSEASTTHSLEEFRRSLTAAEASALQPVPVTSPFRSPSPASTDSDDPDRPLDLNEFDEYYEVMHDQGYKDDTWIALALKHTRSRPDLAEEVLAAWHEGEPLPNKRGVWSKEDDEDVESGDSRAMTRLERKHTRDGWGGISERLNFLEAYRRARGE